MTFLYIVAAAVALVWSALLVHRGSMLVACAVYLCAGYVFGHHFANYHLGPIPLTIERVLLVGMVIAAVWRLKLGRLELKQWTNTDWLLALFVGLLTLSTLLNPPPHAAPADGSPMWRLIAAYWIPLVLYWIAKSCPIGRRELRQFIAILGCLGLYLAGTAIAEVTRNWWAVFPRYIADPILGIHFGRARGPTLMAASMGVYLTFCGLAIWFFWNDASRIVRLAILAIAPAFVVAIFFTYTRSAWLGAAAAVLVVMSFELRGVWRHVALGCAITTGLFLAAAKWDSILSFKRDVDNSASDTQHSVEQRSSFTYVSWRMFQDRPIFGCGFGRFYDQKLPYLADRRQQVELESLRGLQHHNTVLSILTETGLVGLSLFLFLLAAFVQTGWRLARAKKAPDWVRHFGVFQLAAVASYFGSAVFHDLSLSPTEHWALFTFAGVATSLRVRFVDVSRDQSTNSDTTNSAREAPSQFDEVLVVT